MLLRGLNDCVVLVRQTKKPAQKYSVAGFTIRSLTPVVTTWGNQFIASTYLMREPEYAMPASRTRSCTKAALLLIAVSMPHSVDIAL